MKNLNCNKNIDLNTNYISANIDIAVGMDENIYLKNNYQTNIDIVDNKDLRAYVKEHSSAKSTNTEVIGTKKETSENIYLDDKPSREIFRGTIKNG